MKYKPAFLFAALPLFLFAQTALAQTAPIRLTIVHTNDLQSRLLGFGPESEYTPATTGDDATIGGMARVATVIRSLKEEAPHSTLVIDGGDFLMGTLFHTIAREEGLELRLMHHIGYDAATLGNHEFDFRPQGLAQIINSALAKGGAPPLLLANAVFDETDARDDELQALFQQGVVQEYRLFERNGLKIGVFGLMGKDAAEVSPFAAPMRFADPIAAAQRVAKKLREEEKADLIICASHGGVWRESEDSPWRGEDLDLAAQAPEIDVIVGGHSHTLLREPLRVKNTLVLQAGSEGRAVGVLDLEITGRRAMMKSYRMIAIDDAIAADPAVQEEIARIIPVIEQRVLHPYGFAFAQTLAETSFDLRKAEDNSNLGNFVSDAIRWGIDRHQYDPRRPRTRTIMAVESNGMIRDEIAMGRTGVLQVSDLFRLTPLGLGMVEDTPGYPLVSFYLTAAEIKRALEVLTSLYPLKGSSYYLQPSGLRFEYHPRRVLFDRVIAIEIENESGEYQNLDLSRANRALYKVGCNFYVATFIRIVGGFTYGLLEIAPKDSAGRVIEDLKSALVDARPDLPGIQEAKEWEAVLAYSRSFADHDGDGLAEIPEKYRQPQLRIARSSSLNPVLLFQNATAVTWVSAVLAFAGVLVVVLLVKRIVQRLLPALRR